MEEKRELTAKELRRLSRKDLLLLLLEQAKEAEKMQNALEDANKRLEEQKKIFGLKIRYLQLRLQQEKETGSYPGFAKWMFSGFGQKLRPGRFFHRKAPLQESPKDEDGK